jgi:hypothetical protein
LGIQVGGIFLKILPRLFLLMEGFEHLTLTDDALIKDPVMSYTPEKLCHHVVAQTLFANPPSKGAERQA